MKIHLINRTPPLQYKKALLIVGNNKSNAFRVYFNNNFRCLISIPRFVKQQIEELDSLGHQKILLP